MHTHAPIGAVAVGRVPESADFATDFATERRPTSADAAIIGVWVWPFTIYVINLKFSLFTAKVIFKRIFLQLLYSGLTFDFMSKIF